MIKAGDSFNQLVTIAVLCYVRIDYKFDLLGKKKASKKFCLPTFSCRCASLLYKT